jgi:hypothetical protein
MFTLEIDQDKSVGFNCRFSIDHVTEIMKLDSREGRNCFKELYLGLVSSHDQSPRMLSAAASAKD